MPKVLRSSSFTAWLSKLGDDRARAKIADRVLRAQEGNFGDCAPVGEGVSEMRIHYGPGYRVYFVRRAEAVYLLLCAGDKSTQKRDIERAKDMARALEGSG